MITFIHKDSGVFVHVGDNVTEYTDYAYVGPYVLVEILKSIGVSAEMKIELESIKQRKALL